MIKFILSSVLIVLSSVQANAQLLSGCATAHGSLVHTVSNVEGKIIGSFTFPSFQDLAKDPSGRTRRLNAPLSNEGLFSDNLDFQAEKNTFLEKIFGDSFSFQTEFDFCEVQQSSDKSLTARFCFKRGPFEINGLKLRRLEFSIQNQMRTSLIGSEGQTGQTEVVYADLFFTTESDSSGVLKAYRSSYSYYPNGNSTQCSLDPSAYKTKSLLLAPSK